MNEDFVTFDLAKKLKDKGFIGNVDIGQYGGYYYHDGEDIDVWYDCVDNADIAANEYLRPTISQAIKWLREEKELYIVIIPYPTMSTKSKVSFCWYYKCNSNGMYMDDELEADDNSYNSYEQAAIAAIEYIIDNLL